MLLLLGVQNTIQLATFQGFAELHHRKESEIEKQSSYFIIVNLFANL
jgi:hypothetical protein